MFLFISLLWNKLKDITGKPISWYLFLFQPWNCLCFVISKIYFSKKPQLTAVLYLPEEKYNFELDISEDVEKKRFPGLIFVL